MDKLKNQIKIRLIANVLMDKCAHCDRVIFRDAWCTQERVVRFTTPFFREICAYKESDAGRWKTGDAVMYEVQNSVGTFAINCVFDPTAVPREKKSICADLMKICGRQEANPVSLRTWDFSSLHDANRLFDEFDRFLTEAIETFESDISKKLQKLASEKLMEGAETSVTLSKYERNPEARAACLAAHGTSCAVCGFDFSNEYGPAFAGKIEVHHIVPLNQIGEEYVVDPVKDLIPVCPNCHTALHSKKDGVYTLEELRTLRHEK